MESVSLYLGTDAGVSIWRSGPEGQEELISTDVPGPVRAMRGSVTHPERVYAAVYSEGVCRTDDAGAHWTKVFDPDYARVLAIDPSNDDVVYVDPDARVAATQQSDSREAHRRLRDRAART